MAKYAKGEKFKFKESGTEVEITAVDKETGKVDVQETEGLIVNGVTQDARWWGGRDPNKDLEPVGKEAKDASEKPETSEPKESLASRSDSSSRR